MLAGELIRGAGITEEDDPALFLCDEVAAPTEVEIWSEIDKEVTGQCDDCLPNVAYMMRDLTGWVAIGRLSTERAAKLINERVPCGHLFMQIQE